MSGTTTGPPGPASSAGPRESGGREPRARPSAESLLLRRALAAARELAATRERECRVLRDALERARSASAAGRATSREQELRAELAAARDELEALRARLEVSEARLGALRGAAERREAELEPQPRPAPAAPGNPAEPPPAAPQAGAPREPHPAEGAGAGPPIAREHSARDHSEAPADRAPAARGVSEPAAAGFPSDVRVWWEAAHRRRILAEAGLGEPEVVLAGALPPGPARVLIAAADADERARRLRAALGGRRDVAVESADPLRPLPAQAADAVWLDETAAGASGAAERAAALDAALREGGAVWVEAWVGPEDGGLAPGAARWLARLWPELPPRLRVDVRSARVVEDFAAWEAGRRRERRPGGHALLRALQAALALEAFAAFGHGVERLLDPAFAPGWDPRRSGHRRLLEAAVELDERCIDAGEADPVRAVALFRRAPVRPRAPWRGRGPARCGLLPEGAAPAA